MILFLIVDTILNRYSHHYTMPTRADRAKSLIRRLFCLEITAMMCVPHAYWHNLYTLLMAAGCLCILARIRPEQRPAAVRDPWLFIAAAVFLGLCFVTAAWSAYPFDALRTASFYLCGAVLGATAAMLFRKAEEAETLFGYIYTALILTSVFGLIRFARGMDLYGADVHGLMTARLGSTLEHGINYGEFTALAFPLSLVWAHERPGKKRRIACFSLLIFALSALAFTYSRTGYAALGVSLLALLPPRRWPLLLAVSAMALFLLPESVRSRILSVMTLTDASASGRFTLWRECLAAARRSLLTGVGLGSENFLNAYLPCSTNTLPFTPPHANMGYLEILLSLGVAGEAAFLLFFLGIFALLRRAEKRTSDQRDRKILRALTASLAGTVIANVFEHVWFYPRVLFFWCVVYGTACGMSAERMTRTP